MTAQGPGGGQVVTRHQLVLASASPRRAEIMRSAGFEFRVIPSSVDEAAVSGRAPVDLAKRLAEQKAAAVVPEAGGDCVVAADTVVELDGVSLGKPDGPADAARMLRVLAGRSHCVHTGVAVAVGGQVESGVETTIVNMRDYGDGEIKAYVRGGSALDKAGAYGIQDEEFAPVSSYTGSYLNVVGLPVGLLARLLLAVGEIDPATAARLENVDR